MRNANGDWFQQVCSFGCQPVRDLAFLLLSPSPWQASANLAPQHLLGPHGWPLLAELDAEPSALLDWLAAHPVNRLGRYAELLLAFWFRRAPHCELVAHNLPVRTEDGRTVGEFDFLIRLDGAPWHIELASKYYLMLGHAAVTLIGASLRDGWLLKAAKLEAQLTLARHPAAAAVLPPGFNGAPSAARITGWLFLPDSADLSAPLEPSAPRGWFAPLAGVWPKRRTDTRWAWLPRLQWLAPARVDELCTYDEEALRRQLADIDRPQLVAEVSEVEPGQWQEVARGFVIPDSWPNPELLAALSERLGIATPDWAGVTQG
jgi:hypothetical protein